MKLAAMQPYFLPYLGYFDLLNRADLWIVYDVAQYIRHGWVNRNRVLHPVSGWQYVVVPLKKHHYTTPINEVEISTAEDWKPRILKQLDHYKRQAPGYDQVTCLMEEHMSMPENNLARLNVALFRQVGRYLGIDRPIHIFSEMDLALPPTRTPEDLAIELCRAIGANEYINPPGGAGLYHSARFAELGIKLTIQSFRNMTYACGRYQFEPALSILDVMMWNAGPTIKRYLDTASESEA